MATQESALTGLEPPSFWTHFEAITKLARPSRHEEPMIERVRARAAEHGFELHQDAGRKAAARLAGGGSGRFGAAVRQLRTHPLREEITEMLRDLRNLITLRTDERARQLRRTALPVLVGVLALGLLAGTASAGLDSTSAGATTTEETTTTADTTTDEPETTETTTTTEETTPVTTVTTVEVTTTEGTTTTGVGVGGAAVVGAAAAQSQDESSTQWGWIAFGILAAAVVIFGIVWLIRRPRQA